MKILFSMRHSGALRNYASTLSELAVRGHEIHLAFMMADKLGDGRLLWELTNDYSNITYGELGKKTPWRFWLGMARAVRAAADYVRYATPEYKDAHALRERAASRVPSFLRVFLSLPLVQTRFGLRTVSKVLLAFEYAIPTDRWVADTIASQNPDVVLITPLVDIGSDQVEYVKAARALGVRSALCVHSWDNLTNKGLIRVLPDRVYVWNEIQKREAVSMHDAAPESVVVTGAPVYDQWFARRPSTTREEFCRKVGLPADKPFFLYLCSSQFIAPDEADFIEKWIHAVRSAADPRVREAGLLIRPHPENLQPWQRFDLSELRDVVLWPRGGANPVDANSKNDYFDSMFHAAAAVGINTSAQIEAAIVGRQVFSVRVPEYAGTQEGTLHFHYLLSENGGMLHLADSLAAHTRQLVAAIDRTEEDARRLQNFVQSFVRPAGLDAPATPLLADAIEQLARMPKPAPVRPSLWSYLVRLALYPAAVVMKFARYFTRLTRKRERQLRPITASDFFLKRFVYSIPANFFRWGPAKRFAKRYIVPRVLPEMMTGGIPTEQMAAVPKILQRMSTSSKPIVVGPWVSEVGFELLYWIPFLNWVKTYRPFDVDRLVVISRGGAAPWYRNITSNYIDLFDWYTPEQFRAKNEDRLQENKQKHLVLTEFDREILKLAYQHLGCKEVDRLHPMYMYRLFYPYWKSQMSLDLVHQFASFERLPPIDASDVTRHLPRNYTAVRFYFNESFPDTEENRTFVMRLIHTLSDAGDIVLLNPDLHIDDHWDLQLRHPRVHTIDHLMTPRNNLEIQTKVISQARAFVGTYGGLSYLAPLYGVTSLAFYSHGDKFSPRHLELARRVFGKMKRGSYVVLDTTDVEVLSLAFGDSSPFTKLLERTSDEVVSPR